MLEPGMRPVPWPPWSGRFGSKRIALSLLTIWLCSLVAGLLARYLAGIYLRAETASTLISIAGEVALNVPWLLAVLWTLHVGWKYGLALIVLSGLLLPHPNLILTGVSEGVGLGVFAAILHGYGFDVGLRRASSLGLFFVAILCGAIAVASTTLLFSLGKPAASVEILAGWDRSWLTRLAVDVIATLPLAFLLGPVIDAQKRIRIPWLPPFRPSARSQLLTLMLCMVTAVIFCVVWTLATQAGLGRSIQQLVYDDAARAQLLKMQRVSDFRNGALLALLLGIICGGAALVLLLFQRYQEELRMEVQRGTEALRHRHLQLATLQQVTEAASRSLDPESVFQQMAQSMARLADAAQTTVYVPEGRKPAPASSSLRLVQQVSQRPSKFEFQTRVPLEDPLVGKCFSSGSIFSVSSSVHEAAGNAVLRAQCQAHGMEAALCVPILGEHGTLGVVQMLFDSQYDPDEEERRLLRLIGRAVGSAVERAETHAQARRFANELGGLYRFSQELAAESDESGILKVATSSARRLLEARTAAVFLLSGEASLEDRARGAAPEYTSPRARLRCVSIESAVPVADLQNLETPYEDPGAIGEAIRENRLIRIDRNSVSGTLLAGEWREALALIIPLPQLARNEIPAGALVLTFDGNADFRLEASGLAEEIARQTGAGLRRARLVETTRKQAEELRILDQIGRSLSQHLNTVGTLEQLVQNVSRIVRAEFATVFTYDPDSQALHVRATTIPHPEMKDVRVSVNSTSLNALCLKEGRSLVSCDMNQDPRTNHDLNQRFQTGSAIVVPLGPPGQRFGVLMANNRLPGEFSTDDIRRLEQLAQLASAAIERAKHYEEACQRADELILLNEVGHLLVENPALESTLERIADLVSRNFQAAGVGFMLATEQGDALISRGVSSRHREQLKYTRVPLAFGGITAQAFKKNLPIIVENAANDRRIHAMLFDRIPDIASGVLVPMTGAHGCVGVLGLWKSKPQRYSPRDLQCLGNVARLAAAAVERDELGRALRISEARVQEIVDGVHAMMFSVDARGNILSFNAAAERISGWKRDAVIGESLARIVSPREAEQIRINSAVANAFRSQDCSSEMILNWKTLDGRERKIRWSASFLRGSDGTPNGLVCLGIDITEQILLEAQLLQAQKMESVGALAGGMAHDFNNLLGGIIGQCSLARSELRGVRATEPRQPAATAGAQTSMGFDTCLARIESAAQRGADLTAKLLAFARKSVLQPQAVDIAALIRETVELLAPSLPANIIVEQEIAPILEKVHGDPTQLQQVLINLCVNARDAMPSGGTLIISAQPQTGATLLEVSDTGTGMSDEVQQHLFEPFFTTKGPGKGTGLGLSVVFGIVRSHGGQINVHSQPGAGSRFSIRLPCPTSRSIRKTSTNIIKSSSMFPAVTQSSSSALHKAVALGGTETILLIDDDTILRETVRKLLENLGYRVLTAAGGVESLSLLDHSPDLRPHVLLLDVMMPGLSGPALLAELRKRMPQVPIVLVSGYSADKTVTDMLNAGAQELIQKPFAIEALAGAIRRAADNEPVRD
jgi:PAS domain S-box-containing protein